MIVTPHDDPNTYDPDWLHQLSIAGLNSSQAITRTADRKFSNEWMQFKNDYDLFLALLQGAVSGSSANATEAWDRYPEFSRARAWYGGGKGHIRPYMEALLLTSAPYDKIASDMGTDEETVRAYERLYFNCRTGLARLSHMRSTLFVFDHHNPADFRRLPQDVMWRFLAFSFGYPALVFSWGWTPHDNTVDEKFIQAVIDIQGLRHIMTRMVSGRMETIDIINLFTHSLNKERHLIDTGQDKPDERLLGSLAYLIQLFVPKVNRNYEKMQLAGVTQEGIILEREANRVVDGTEITDKGIEDAAAAMNETIKGRLMSVAPEGKKDED